MAKRRLFSVIVLLPLLGAACVLPTGPADSSDAASGDSAAADATHPDAGFDDIGGNDAGDELPGLDSLASGWNEIQTGGETSCSRGAPWAFYVHPGASDRFVVNFIGGGACWDNMTCAGGTFFENIDYMREALASTTPPPGLFDMDNADNPIGDWTHVVVPYCTGDVHWGNNEKTYMGMSGNYTIKHVGAVNAQVVLDWIDDNFADPQKIFVTGCSAGSYGSILWSAYLAQTFANASIYQFGDSGAGIITETFFNDSFPSWNATAALPSWIAGLDPAQLDLTQLDLPLVYNEIAGQYPNAMFSQFNTIADETQSYFYQAMGGTGGAAGWAQKMLTSVDAIKAGSSNFRAFLSEGSQHCVIEHRNFYSYETEGVLVVDWLSEMLSDQSIDNVTCATCQ